MKKFLFFLCMAFLGVNVSTYAQSIDISLNKTESNFKANPAVHANPYDSIALVAIYDSTSGDNWTHNDYWKQDSVYKWYGVVINSDGHVTELHLYNNNLNGKLPSYIKYLKYIRRLEMQYNSLSDTIPSQIGQLDSLQYLDLSHNFFSGAIPQTIGDLKYLQVLHLENNQLTTIPDSIGKLTNLLELYLQDNQLQGKVPRGIGSLYKLTILHLEDNQLTYFYLPDTGLYNVQYLYLQHNNFTGQVPNIFFHAGMHELLEADLSYNYFTDSVVINEDLPGISSIDLSHNQLTKIVLKPSSSDFYKINLNYNCLKELVLDNTWNGLGYIGEMPLDHNYLSSLPNMSDMSGLYNISVDNNYLDFGDLQASNVNYFTSYAPQAKVGQIEHLTPNVGDKVLLTVSVDGSNNQFQWYKDGQEISGATSSSFVIQSYDNDAAGVYYCKITNGDYPDLTLYSNNKYVGVSPNQYTITVQVDPPAAAASYSGDGTFVDGRKDTLKVVPNPTWRFLGWKINNEAVWPDLNFPIIVTSDTTATACFIKDTVHYTVNVEAIPPEGGVVSGGGQYQYGETATLSADPNPGWQFVRWCQYNQAGNWVYCTNQPTVNIKVTKNEVWKAEFQAISTNISEINSADVKIYPNPATNTVIISAKEIIPQTITVMNLMGQKQNISFRKQGNNIVINVCNLTPGIYILQIKSTYNHIITKKLIVK